MVRARSPIGCTRGDALVEGRCGIHGLMRGDRCFGESACDVVQQVRSRVEHLHAALHRAARVGTWLRRRDWQPAERQIGLHHHRRTAARGAQRRCDECVEVASDSRVEVWHLAYCALDPHVLSRHDGDKFQSDRRRNRRAHRATTSVRSSAIGDNLRHHRDLAGLHHRKSASETIWDRHLRVCHGGPNLSCRKSRSAMSAKASGGSGRRSQR